MQMTGEQRIAASREAVWEALNNPDVLRQCIPGCQSLERQSEDRFLAVAEVKIGPIGARFKGDVQLTELDPPSGYRIIGSGNGGIAGSAKGGANVRLSDTGDGGTLVSYDVEAEVGGRMAQLGGPIIDATARNLAGKFFTRFSEVVGESSTHATVQSEAPASSTTIAASISRPAVAAPETGMSTGAVSLWGWVAALVTAILAGYVLGSNGVSGGIALITSILVVVVAAAAFEAGRRGGRS